MHISHARFFIAKTTADVNVILDESRTTYTALAKFEMGGSQILYAITDGNLSSVD